MAASKLDLIVSQIAELSLEEKSDDPVRNLFSVSVNVSNKIGSIMCELRKQERNYAPTHSQTPRLDQCLHALHGKL